MRIQKVIIEGVAMPDHVFINGKEHRLVIWHKDSYRVEYVHFDEEKKQISKFTCDVLFKYTQLSKALFACRNALISNGFIPNWFEKNEITHGNL